MRRRRHYQNGIKLGFVLNSQFEWGIVLIDPSWNLTYNASYPIEMAVDTRASGAATATPSAPRRSLIPLKPSVALFKDFMEGERLEIQTAGGTYVFDLTNTSRDAAQPGEMRGTLLRANSSLG